MLSFKYLVDKLEVNFDEPIRQVLTGELLSKARKTINYEKKRILVRNNLNAFRQFTKDPNHFNVVKDLDYFFLVFESFFGEAKPETPPKPESLPALSKNRNNKQKQQQQQQQQIHQNNSTRNNSSNSTRNNSSRTRNNSRTINNQKNKKQKNYNIIITQQLNML